MAPSFLPILMYHQICPISHPAYDPYLSVSCETFEKQLVSLKKKGWHFISFAQASKKIASNEKTTRQLCLTFDDACDNFYLYAFPILKKLGLSGSLFIIGNTLTGETYEHLPSAGIKGLSTESIREMTSFGIEIGSHSMSHRELASVKTKEDLMFEFEKSKQLLESISQKPVISFCYPRGSYDHRALHEVQSAGYLSACSIQRGSYHKPEDIFCLKRVRMSEKHVGIKLHYTMSRLWAWSKR